MERLAIPSEVGLSGKMEYEKFHIKIEMHNLKNISSILLLTKEAKYTIYKHWDLSSALYPTFSPSNITVLTPLDKQTIIAYVRWNIFVWKTQ